MSKKLFDPHLSGEGRDKAKDNKLFNCSEEWEIEYVASRYGVHQDKVESFLKRNCHNGMINRLTHAQVYILINEKLGLPVAE